MGRKLLDALKDALKCKEVIVSNSCITADGKKYFFKRGSGANDLANFKGQHESLKAIDETNTIRISRPVTVLESMEHANDCMIVMEFLDLKHIGSNAGALGRALADLHMHNWALDEAKRVNSFGFHVPTGCGDLMQGNKWRSDWVEYYREKLQEQFDLIRDDEAQRLWKELSQKLPEFFIGLKEEIRPSLLHGDLWSGNVGTVDGKPAIYDPGSFYGHHEYDLGIAGLFGMSSAFFNEYHKKLPKEPGFEERHDLYKLFHLLNHWNIFGSGYRSQSMSIMRKLVKK